MISFRSLKFFLYSIFISREYALKKAGVKIGNNCYIASDVKIGSEPYLISIGNNVALTSGVKLFTHGGGRLMRDTIPDFDTFGKIYIGNNVYIGNNTLIMPGVTILDNVIVGAGSVVTKSIPSGYIVAGNPAKIVGNIESYKDRMQYHNFQTKGLNFAKKKEIILCSDSSLFISKKFLKVD